MTSAAADTHPAAELDPQQRLELAHTTAQALLSQARDGHAQDVTQRLQQLADDEGIDEMAQLWSARPAETLPGTLWRLYVLRAGITRGPVEMARAYEAGRRLAPVHEAVAGVAEPYGPTEVVALSDTVFAGVFTGDLAVALERAGAFCRVVATGWAALVDAADDGSPAGAPGSRQVRQAADLQRTGIQLAQAADRWRNGTLA